MSDIENLPSIFSPRKKDLLKLEEEIKIEFKNIKWNPDYLKQLEYFRNLLSGKCILTGQEFTILNCSTLVKNGNCNFNKDCQTREKWRVLLSFQEL